MQFSKAQKNLHQPSNYNPPPGYYFSSPQLNSDKLQSQPIDKFSKQQRFHSNQKAAIPGPGYYYNNKLQSTRKRILQQAKKKQLQNKLNNNNESDIKISSIPSIPKKFTTRIYQQLAPDKSNLNQIGPTTYQANYNFGQKKIITHKINPEHKNKKFQDSQPQIYIPHIAQQLRNQKKQFYKKALIKASNINKNLINPSDLCLQVIILRQKLLRIQQNPAPGHYYNNKYQSSFKQFDPQLLPQYQLMMGKQPRFKKLNSNQKTIGPGAYNIKQLKQKQGGFIPKQQRQFIATNVPPAQPGPGAYRVQNTSKQPINPKGTYPPIFGSGCNRFYSSTPKINDTPGPGSYKIDLKKKNKCKYIKIKKQNHESHLSSSTHPHNNRISLFDINNQQMFKNQTNSPFHTSKDKSTYLSNTANHYFSSKVQRFTIKKQQDNTIGPGDYQTQHQSLIKKSYNKNRNSYIGSKNARFQQTIIRPNVGPGTYYKNNNNFDGTKN